LVSNRRSSGSVNWASERRSPREEHDGADSGGEVEEEDSDASHRPPTILPSIEPVVSVVRKAEKCFFSSHELLFDHDSVSLPPCKGNPHQIVVFND
jgi:hypothetical protein